MGSITNNSNIDHSENFSLQSYMQNRWERTGRKLAFTAEDREGWSEWHDKTTKKLRKLTGYDTMVKCPPNAKVTESTEFEDYTRQRLVIQTEPGVYMPMYVLIPKTGKKAYSAVIATHGHVSGGKLAVAGCRENPDVANRIDIHNYDYGLHFVRSGFIVFCPDARGFGERLEKWESGNIMNSSCKTVNQMGYPLGQTITGMWAWDIHRLIDYIETRDDCLPGNIGCAGLSGGGLQSLWAAALDQRIGCTVISGYMYGYKESLLDLPCNCSCNFVPHLYEYVDMGDIAALIAPRPLLIETGTKDDLNGASGVDNVLSQINIIKKSYALFVKSHLLKHDIFEGEHRWNGVEALPWMRQYI